MPMDNRHTPLINCQKGFSPNLAASPFAAIGTPACTVDIEFIPKGFFVLKILKKTAQNWIQRLMSGLRREYFLEQRNAKVGRC
jgi:hypothetical protein